MTHRSNWPTCAPVLALATNVYRHVLYRTVSGFADPRRTIRRSQRYHRIIIDLTLVSLSFDFTVLSIPSTIPLSARRIKFFWLRWPYRRCPIAHHTYALRHTFTATTHSSPYRRPKSQVCRANDHVYQSRPPPTHSVSSPFRVRI